MPRAKPTPETNINVSVTFHQGQPFTNIMRIFDPTPHGAVRGILSLISLFVWTIRSCSTMATAFQRGVNLSNGMYKKSSLVTKHKNIFNPSRRCKKAFKTPFLPPGSLTNTLPVSSVIPFLFSLFLSTPLAVSTAVHCHVLLSMYLLQTAQTIILICYRIRSETLSDSG